MLLLLVITVSFSLAFASTAYFARTLNRQCHFALVLRCKSALGRGTIVVIPIASRGQ